MKKDPQPYVDPNLDPVLLVPGIAGSILKAVDTDNCNKDERVWVRIVRADYKFRTKLWSRFDPSTGMKDYLFTKLASLNLLDKLNLNLFMSFVKEGSKILIYLCYFLFSVVHRNFMPPKMGGMGSTAVCSKLFEQFHYEIP